MKKLVNCCDMCNRLGENLKLAVLDSQELCDNCVEIQNSLNKKAINEQNIKNSINLFACVVCKKTGIIHRSIYRSSPGYYDEPDPTIYCSCPKGKALNPDTKYIVTDQLHHDNNTI